MKKFIYQLLILIICLFTIPFVNAEFSLLHEFAGGINDGKNPYGRLTLSENTLYGMTYYGGKTNCGVVFKMEIDGSNYTNLHEFVSGPYGKQNTQGSLALSGSTLYGMTLWGSSLGNGVIFKMNTNGSGFVTLHEFASFGGDGDNPYGSLTLSGNTLYGTTAEGGSIGNGVVFKINTDGSNYTNLHEFIGGNDDGKTPYDDLTLVGSSLYGMTIYGGDNDKGVIFKMEIDGGNYTNLHEFAGGSSDGQYPRGSLTLLNSSLYGMTHTGGTENRGVIFKIDIDGANFTNLHSLVYNATAFNGYNPHGNLTISDGTLYGMTLQGGSFSYGVIFEMEIDGSNYTNLHFFSSGSDNGKSPYGSLLIDGDEFYGMTHSGGDSNFGTVFMYSEIPEPCLFIILLLILFPSFIRRGAR